MRSMHNVKANFALQPDPDSVALVYSVRFLYRKRYDLVIRIGYLSEFATNYHDSAQASAILTHVGESATLPNAIG